jgi:hypothetical protein
LSHSANPFCVCVYVLGILEIVPCLYYGITNLP